MKFYAVFRPGRPVHATRSLVDYGLSECSRPRPGEFDVRDLPEAFRDQAAREIVISPDPPTSSTGWVQYMRSKSAQYDRAVELAIAAGFDLWSIAVPEFVNDTSDRSFWGPWWDLPDDVYEQQCLDDISFYGSAERAFGSQSIDPSEFLNA